MKSSAKVLLFAENKVYCLSDVKSNRKNNLIFTKKSHVRYKEKKETSAFICD